MKPTFVRQESSYVSDSGKSVKPVRDAGLPDTAVVMTLNGAETVSALGPGARVVTRDTGFAILKRVAKRRITARPVHIKARSLGHNRPEHDTSLPAGQPILVRDWRAQAIFGRPQALVAAARLVDGEFVILREETEMVVYDLIFDAPHVLYVDGLEVASHLGTHALP